MNFRNLEEFWPFYVNQHSKASTRRWHFLGTFSALLCLLLSPLLSLWLALLSPLLAYGPAWFSHLFFEGNSPASFSHPLWSLLCDLRMFALMLTGRMDREIKRLEMTPKARRDGGSSGKERTNPAWKYCIEVELEGDKKLKGYKYVKCKFCGQTVTGGIARFKEHLVKSRKNVRSCPNVPIEVENEMKDFLSKTDQARRRLYEEMEEVRRVGAYTNLGSSGFDEHVPTGSSGAAAHKGRGPMDLFLGGGACEGGSGKLGVESGSAQGPSKQVTLNDSWKNEERRRVCKSVGRFFIENTLPFNVANSPSYQTVFQEVGNFGRGFKPPSMHELRTWILREEVETVKAMMDAASWSEIGCSIMSDGWTDTKGRTLINFLVNIPRGTWFLKSVDASEQIKNAEFLFKLMDEVVEEVGEKNVIQVITDNATTYKAAGEMLMKKREHLYWTPCAAHCIGLMLEDIFKLPLHDSVFKKAKQIINFIYNHAWVLAMVRNHVGGDLVRPAVTCFATAFLTLQRLLIVKDHLESFFTSKRWKSSSYSFKEKGKSVQNIILKSKSFWPGVAYVIRTTKPLVMVLRMVDSEKYPPMGFIYEAMDRAKEEIARNLRNNEEKYKQLWDIVDKRWDKQLHTHLHAAAYFLNPQCLYEPTFNNDYEVKVGWYSCLQRMVVDREEREKIDLQSDAYVNAKGLFGWANAVDTRKKRSPADWWRAFGAETPELMKFAIRILSLTCSASGCERNWSSFNQVHTKRRNKLKQEKLNDLVFCMFNLRLKQKKVRKKTLEDPLCLQDIDSDDEWISEFHLGTSEIEVFHELDANLSLEDEIVDIGELGG